MTLTGNYNYNFKKAMVLGLNNPVTTLYLNHSANMIVQ